MRVRALSLILAVNCAIASIGCATRAPAHAGEAAGATEVVLTALSLIGTPYAAEGASPAEGFDCSGLVTYVYARAVRATLPRNTAELARSGRAVASSTLRPGDLVFYNTLNRPYSHVGIYVGESRFVHAPATGGAVRMEDMRRDYWTRRFNGARRLVD